MQFIIMSALHQYQMYGYLCYLVLSKYKGLELSDLYMISLSAKQVCSDEATLVKQNSRKTIL